MKKILILGFIIILVFVIYLNNIDTKVYYLALGDSLATGESADKQSYGYSKMIKNYLEEKDVLETYNNEFAENGYRTTDLINAIKDNRKTKLSNKDVTIQNALIKADLVTISIGANDILNKINTEEPIDYEAIYNYIDELAIDLDKLLKLTRQYCKEDIILIGYYNPYPFLNDQQTSSIFKYLNQKYKTISNKYQIEYIEIDDIFKQNSTYLPNPNDIHPSKEGYKAISNKIIDTIEKTVLNA